MKGPQIERLRFIEAVELVRRAFPNLTIDETAEPEHVDGLIEIPAQPALPFRVVISLQGDELHLNVGEHLWVEWFPCGETAVFDRFVDAVAGILSGRYRIVESSVAGKVISARLQRPVDDRWRTLATSSSLDVRVMLPLRRSHRVLQKGTTTSA
jgi:hypothetical protein